MNEGRKSTFGEGHRPAPRVAASAALLGLALAACAAPVADRDQPVSERPTLYACEDGTLAAAVFVDDREPAVLLSVGGASALRLPQAEAASGARYTDGSTVLWVKGSEARLQTPTGLDTTCTAQG